MGIDRNFYKFQISSLCNFNMRLSNGSLGVSSKFYGCLVNSLYTRCYFFRGQCLCIFMSFYNFRFLIQNFKLRNYFQPKLRVVYFSLSCLCLVWDKLYRSSSWLLQFFFSCWFRIFEVFFIYLFSRRRYWSLGRLLFTVINLRLF